MEILEAFTVVTKHRHTAKRIAHKDRYDTNNELRHPRHASVEGHDHGVEGEIMAQVLDDADPQDAAP